MFGAEAGNPVLQCYVIPHNAVISCVVIGLGVSMCYCVPPRDAVN